jgi:drug/metabolite transporter (DMT)-like permease
LDRRAGPTVYLALAATTLFWGLSFVATKVALETIPPTLLLFVRFAVAGIILILFLPRGIIRNLSLEDHALLFATAAFEPGLYFLFETLALQRIHAAEASLIVATIPVIVLFFAAVFLGERNSGQVVFGIALSIAGVAVLTLTGTGSGLYPERSLAGYLLMFGAVITASGYITMARSLTRKLGALLVTTMQVGFGGIFFAPVALWKWDPTVLTEVSLRSGFGLGFLIVFATVGAFFCYNYSLTRINAAVASAYLNGIPLVTAVAAWFLLGERLTMVQCIGGGLILLSVHMVNRQTVTVTGAPDPLRQ